MNPAEYYLKTIYQKSHFYGTWLPNANMELGMIGVMENFEFKQVAFLLDFGIRTKINLSQTELSKTEYSYSSHVDIKFKSKITADVQQLAKADVDLKFNKSGAFLFEAHGCFITELSNKYDIGIEVKKLFKNKIWQQEWVVVDRLINAEAATIMISSSENSHLGLSIKDKEKKFILTDASIGLETEYKSGELNNIIAAKELNPLFGVSRIKHSYLARLFNMRDKARYGGPVLSRVADELLESDGTGTFHDEMWENLNYDFNHEATDN